MKRDEAKAFVKAWLDRVLVTMFDEYDEDEDEDCGDAEDLYDFVIEEVTNGLDFDETVKARSQAAPEAAACSGDGCVVCAAQKEKP